MKFVQKGTLQKICAAMVFLITICFVLYKADFFFESKYSYQKYADFYEEEENIDVLFFGTSHVINAVYPMELWNDYGIVSYNLSNYSEALNVNYWQLVNALKHTKPKLVVIDLFSLGWDSTVVSKQLHHFTDYMPLSKLKLDIVTDLLPKEDQMEYLVELSLYHSRWDELSQSDFCPEPWCEKGAEIRTRLEDCEAPELIPKEQYHFEDKGNMEYLQKMIDLCKANNIQVLLTYIPFTDVAPEQLEEANYGYLLAKEQDLSYINFFYIDNLLNHKIDNSDGDHVNVSGARKITDYIGQYIIENFDIEDQRTNECYAHWAEDWKVYKDYKYEMLMSQNDMFNYLLLLYDKNLQVEVYVSQDSWIYQDNTVVELLNNIESLGTLTYHIQEDVGQTGDIIFGVTDRETGEVINYKQFRRTASNVYEIYEP